MTSTGSPFGVLRNLEDFRVMLDRERDHGGTTEGRAEEILESQSAAVYQEPLRAA
jgi:hypothetical protein